MTCNRNIIRQGEDIELDIQSGGYATRRTLTAWLKNERNQLINTYHIDLPLSSGLQHTKYAIKTSQEGIQTISFGQADQPLGSDDVRPISLTVVDTTRHKRTGGELKKTLLKEIDCVTATPDYSGGGETRIIRKSFGTYRESNDVGWLDHMNQTEPSWFAYKVAVDEPQRPYLVEVDYPDDAFRTFCIVVREANTRAYPTTGGVDSGGEFSLTHQMQTHSILHWTQSRDLRIICITPQTRRRAAAAKIRVYKIDGDLPSLHVPENGGRHFANWYEEGTSYLGIYGVPKEGPTLAQAALGGERWAQSVAYMGGDTLWFTPVIYQFGLYPSRYNVSYTSLSTPDTVRIMLMKCEKYGMKFISEFHPEGRELAWPSADNPDRQRGLLISNEGKPGRMPFRGGEGPSFNPLSPENQEWYLNLLGEFVDRYKDSPAFQGISLRLMSWCNPSLNNFHSLQWGYDDQTISLFEKETGIKVPVTTNGSGRFRLRYDWLTNEGRDKWIAWRCEKITDLHRRIRDRVRQARPDLIVYINAFGTISREAGIDAASLAKLDGVRLVNALASYGRRGSYEQGLKNRDQLINLDVMRSMYDPSRGGAFMRSSAYFEAPARAVTPLEELGFPAGSSQTWISGVVNPAGRHYLERWAISVAECDATLLGDGGNAYTLGQPLLREFLREYRNLPDQSFTPRPDARDPVAVWELTHNNQYYFYAVNRERYPVQVRIEFAGSGAVRSVSTGDALPLSNASASFELQPYQLRAFIADAPQKIVHVTLIVPQEEREKVATQVKRLKDFAAEAKGAGPLADLLLPHQIRLLEKSSSSAQAAFSAGLLWQARMQLEHYDLYEIFKLCNRFPPGLRDNGSPSPPPGAVDARQLQKNLTDAKLAVLARSESINPDWVGQSLLMSTGGELSFQISAPISARYFFTLGHATGPAFGPMNISVNDQPTDIISARDTISRGFESTLSHPIRLSQGPATITFRSPSAQIGICYIHLVPYFRELTARYWRTIGPFPGTPDASETLARVFPPELNRDMHADIPISNQQSVRWSSVSGDRDFVDMTDRYGKGPSIVSYAVTQIESPTPQRVRLSYGADYWIKLWLNGKVIADHSVRPGGEARKGQFTCDIDLISGQNELLLKLISGGKDNGFWMSVSDPGDLKITPPAN